MPFGGTLPLMVNHERADLDGTSWYRVLVDGVVRSDSWADEKWNGTQYVAVTTAPTIVAGQPGYYPVHPLSELFLWMNPSLGMLLDSTNLTNALHTLLIEFTNGAGAVIETSTPLTILVNNQWCSASVATADRAATPPRRAMSKTCRAERRGDSPRSTAARTTPRAEATSSNDPHRAP